MTQKQFNSLNRGDIVMPRGDSNTYIVTANYGDRVTAVNSVDITNPNEWKLMIKVTSRELNRID
jgi:hypothetical protein